MIVDVLIVVIVGASFIVGYKAGFLRSIFQTVGYLAGGLGGLYLALQYTDKWTSELQKIGALIGAIFVFAYLGKLAGGKIAQAARATIVRGPLRWVDSLAGGLIEALKAGLLLYLTLTILTWTPWSVAQDAIASSTIYPKVDSHLPSVIKQIHREIEKNFAINLRS